MKDLEKKYVLDLQYFAEDDEDQDDELELDDDGGIDIDLEGLELEDDELETEEEEESEDKTKGDKSKKDDKKQEKTVPLSALEAERKKWQKKLAEATKGKATKAADDDANPDIKSILADAGMDEKTANAIIKALGKTDGKAVNAEKLINKRFRDLEFKELSKNSLYSDILDEDIRADVEDLCERAGLTVEQAYLAKYGKTKLLGNRADIERETEQRVLNSQKKRDGSRIDTTSNGETGDKGKKFTLSKDEKDIARMSGMTEEEYYYTKNSKSIDKMDKIFNRRKKG